MTQEALKKMYQLLLTEPHAPTVCAKLEVIAREALAQEQEPVAYLTRRKIGGTEGLLRADMVDKSAKNQETHDFIPLYTTPPQRTWVGLTDDDVFAVLEKLQNMYHRPPSAIFAQAIEAKLKEKNEAL